MGSVLIRVLAPTLVLWGLYVVAWMGLPESPNAVDSPWWAEAALGLLVGLIIQAVAIGISIWLIFGPILLRILGVIGRVGTKIPNEGGSKGLTNPGRDNPYL